METEQNINKSVVTKLKEWRNSPLQFVTECIKAVPTEQQIELLQAFPKNKRMTVRSGHGCFAKDTIVHMFPYGFKLVQDIQVGDLVMGPDSKPRTVLQLFRGESPMYRIKYYDNTYYDVNEDHTLAVVSLSITMGHKRGEKYTVGLKEYLNYTSAQRKNTIGYKVGVEYPEIPVMIPPYILGIWLGDGTSSRPILSNIDKEVIGIWQLFAEANGLTMTSAEDSISYYLKHDDSNTKNVFIEALKHYNLIGNKHIPKEYLFNSRSNRLKLLAGLIDTDGSAEIKKDGAFAYTFGQSNEDLINDVQFLAQSLGFHAVIQKEEACAKKFKNGTYNCKAKYRLRISRGAVDEIPVQIERKKVPENYKCTRDLHFGFKVEELGIGDYYGFEVDRDHLFVLGDFSVVRNCGKDACISWLALNFLVTRPYAKCIVVAPTNRQLKDIFLAETVKWLRQSLVADEFLIRRDAILHRESPKDWWIRLISPSVTSTKEEQAETLAGIHGEHLLILADEASGISDPVFVPLEGTMTQPDNKVVLISNMTKNFGYFFDTHFHSAISKDWAKFQWDSRKSTNVDKSMPEYFATKYGVESNVFRIRVEGNPPLQDESTLIPLYAAEQCIGNEFEVAEDEPLYLGVDVARYGDDASIIMPRRGLKIFPWETFRKLNTIDLGGFINQTYQELEASGCAIDVIGVGAGVSDWLEKHNMKNLYQVNVASSSSDIAKYNKLRDELWIRVRDNCLLGKYSFPDVKVYGEKESLGQQLASELASVRYKFNSHGGYVVESKKDMKSRGISSPNIADALCLTEYFHNSSTKVFAKEKTELYSKRRFVNREVSSTAWLGI